MKRIDTRKVRFEVYVLFVFVLFNSTVTMNGQEISPAPANGQNLDHLIEWCIAFADPERDEWQRPDKVVRSLHLSSGDIVADLGAGDGYFTRYFAKAVSPGGMAMGLEVSQSKVEYMKKEADRLNLDNYKSILVKYDDPELEPGSVDVVFLCNAYHHLENRVDYLTRLSKSLKQNGRVVLVDFYKKPLPVGPRSLDHKLAKEVVLEEFRQAGYHLNLDKDFLPYQYYLEFKL